MIKTQLSKFSFAIKIKDQNRYEKLNNQTIKNQQQIRNVDVDSNNSKKKNSMARMTQNRWIALFLLWSFNQREAGKKCRNNCLMKRKMFFIIAKA